MSPAKPTKSKPKPVVAREAVPEAAPRLARFAPLVPWLSLALIVAAVGAMFCWTWGTWPDVIVDFGRELYVPWRLNEGEVLYRDLAYFNGPLSPYWNALWFRLLGVGLRTLVVVNLAILGVMLALWYSLLRTIGSRTSALLGCLVLVLLFAFSRYTIAANYNYICPYSHEVTHGLTLSLAAFYFLARYVRDSLLRDVALCGLCVGLVALTKPEILGATLPGVALGLLLAHAASGRNNAQLGRMALAFAGPLLVPFLVATALLSLALGPAAAATGTLGGWKWVFDADITSLPFYRHSMGAQDAMKHIGVLLSILFWYGMLLGMPAGVGLLVWQSRRTELGAAIVSFAVVLAILLWNFEMVPNSDALRPLPFAMAGALLGVAMLWKRVSDRAERGRLAVTVALLIFALLMTAKIFLHVRLIHYGFYLSMPATLLLIFALWDLAPRWLEYSGGSGWMLRGAFLAALLVIVLRSLDETSQKLATLTERVGSGADSFWADSRGEEINRLLAELEALAPPEATLAVVPEGIMLNYLTRRVDPTPYISLMPVEVLMFGETRILEAFLQHPPDYLILTDEDLADYGFQDFRSNTDGYADLLAVWMNDNYQLIGEVPATEGTLLRGLLLERIRPDEPATKADAAPSDPESRPAR